MGWRTPPTQPVRTGLKFTLTFIFRAASLSCLMLCQVTRQGVSVREWEVENRVLTTAEGSACGPSANSQNGDLFCRGLGIAGALRHSHSSNFTPWTRNAVTFVFHDKSLKCFLRFKLRGCSGLRMMLGSRAG